MQHVNKWIKLMRGVDQPPLPLPKHTMIVSSEYTNVTVILKKLVLYLLVNPLIKLINLFPQVLGVEV